jgi:hypothetical protein
MVFVHVSSDKQQICVEYKTLEALQLWVRCADKVMKLSSSRTTILTSSLHTQIEML